jgi:hypothetical protein
MKLDSFLYGKLKQAMDDFNRRQKERLEDLIFLIKEQNKKKRNRRKMKKHAIKS